MTAVFIALITFSKSTWAGVIEGRGLLTDSPVKVESGRLGTVIAFLSAKCPCSMSHQAELKKLSQDYPEFNFVAVHSNPDEEIALAKPYFQNVAFNFPVIADLDQTLANRFRALKTPHAFVLSRTEEILFQGGVSDSRTLERATQLFLREALQDIKSNKTVRTKLARALGCSIKRRSNVL